MPYKLKNRVKGYKGSPVLVLIVPPKEKYSSTSKDAVKEDCEASIER